MTPEIKQRITQLNNGEVPVGYKKTDFGIFPCDWVTDKKLKDLGSFGKGKGLPGDKMTTEGVPCVGYGDIYMKYNHFHFEKAQTFVDEETAAESQPIHKGTLLFTGTGETADEIGKCVCYNGDETIYAGGDIITFASDKVNPLFLSYQQYQDFSLRKKASFGQGHSVVHIQRENLEKLNVAYPKSTEEQSKIAEILMKWDEVIELQEQYINILEARKRYLMEELLLPQKDWEVASLGQLVSKEKGKAVKISENGKIPILDMDYIETGLFSNYTDDDGILASKEDILVLWDGANAGTLLTNVEGIVGSTFALLKIKSRQILPLYLHYWLTIQNQKNSALREGSGIPHMPKDYLKMQKVCYPDISKQTKISKTLALSEVEILLNNEKLKIFVEQRKTLQQYLLNGIVRV